MQRDPLIDQLPKAALKAEYQESPKYEPLEKASKTITKWPRPVAKEALHGLAGDIIKTIEPHTEADPMALLSQFLIAFGNITNRGGYFTAEADKHGTNLFITLVGETAKGRKGTSWGYVKRLFKGIDEDWTLANIVSGLSSGEGLIWAVRDQIEKQEPIKDKKIITGYQTVVIDPGVTDKRLLVLEPEFAGVLRVLKREGNTLSAIIRNSWDSGNLRTITKNSPAVATGAHISVVGHITKNELLKYLDNNEMANGFANRFLWVCVKRSKCLPEGGNLKESDLNPLIEKLKAAVDFAKTAGELKRDSQAREIWLKVYPTLSEGKLGLFGAVTARAEAQVMRLACIYALLDKSNVITKEHLLAALALWDYTEASARYIFGDKIGDYEADQILAALKQKPDGLTKTEIHNLFGRNKSGSQIDRALTLLREYNLAEKKIENAATKNIEKWFLV